MMGGVEWESEAVAKIVVNVVVSARTKRPVNDRFKKETGSALSGCHVVFVKQ